MSLWSIFLAFLIVGVFVIGGGAAAIPLLEHICVDNNWTTIEEFYQMVAVAESTPGPIGVNIATYVGFVHRGALGGVVASIGICCAPFIVALLVIKLLDKYKKSPVVRAAFVGLKAIVVGLILTSIVAIARVVVVDLSLWEGWNVFYAIINWKSLVLLVVLTFLNLKFKLHPLIYIAVGALCGILFL